LWLYDLTRNSRTRFTTGLIADMAPVWSPNGSQIAYCSADYAHKNFGIYVRPSEGSGTVEKIYASKDGVTTYDWSHDGKYIAIQRWGSDTTRSDIWILPLSGDKKPFSYLQTQFNEFQARFSPDGRWIAYTSDETGENEVYIRHFPSPGTAVRVSAAGGTMPVWHPEGRELYYISLDNKTMAAQIRSKGSSLEIGSVSPLFTRPREVWTYDVFPDGKRFLMERFIEPKETDPITIVVNWNAGLKKK